ncbi:MAG: hypothetical protein MUP76_07135 [Acidimicrobiia bacterium]|nr:hypothetical protein [Acidimicrobiia bacterium]
MTESPTPVPVASYGGLGAWSAAELDAAMLESAGIRSMVGGDAHHHAPLFSGHQVMLLVTPADRDEAVALLAESDVGYEDRVVAKP